MDEEKKIEASATPQVSETEQVVPETVEDVESEEQVTTQSTNETDVDESTVSEEQDSEAPVSKEENDKKAESGKMSKLEKENNELRQVKQMFDALNTAATNDPEFMKVANKKLVEQGVLDESILEQLDTKPQPSADGVVDNPAVKWAEAKMREEQGKKEEFFVKFEEKHPELSEGEPKIIRANRSAIGAVAAKRMTEGHSMEESYDLAYKAVMNPNQLVEEGKLQGMAQAQGASPVEGAASGGVAKSSGIKALTPEQRSAAQAFGIKEEDYAKNLGE